MHSPRWPRTVFTVAHAGFRCCRLLWGMAIRTDRQGGSRTGRNRYARRQTLDGAMNKIISSRAARRALAAAAALLAGGWIATGPAISALAAPVASVASVASAAGTV